VKLLPFRINPKQFVIVFTKVSFEIESQKSPVLKTNKFFTEEFKWKRRSELFCLLFTKVFSILNTFTLKLIFVNNITVKKEQNHSQMSLCSQIRCNCNTICVSFSAFFD